MTVRVCVCPPLDPSPSNYPIQLEVRENSAHNTKVTNIQLQVKENSADNT